MFAEAEVPMIQSPLIFETLLRFSAGNEGGRHMSGIWGACQSLPRPHFTVAQPKADDVRFRWSNNRPILIVS
jgi:hypothetical protein